MRLFYCTNCQRITRIEEHDLNEDKLTLKATNEPPVCRMPLKEEKEVVDLCLGPLRPPHIKELLKEQKRWNKDWSD